MIIYPDIELQDGKCVNLRRGSHDDPVEYPVDPVTAARKFEAAGAEHLHVVDLDGVLQSGRDNAEKIGEILAAVNIPVQVGGGIRSMESVEGWMARGAARAVLGTAAVKDRAFLREACARYPGRIVVSIDARDGYVVVEGWRETTSFTAVGLAEELANIGVAAVIYTDIDATDAERDATFGETSMVGSAIDIPLISSGCVHRLDDLSVLKHIPGVQGAIIGRAFFERRINVKEALAVAREPVTEAEFI